MSVDASVLRAMLSAGCSAEQIVAVAEEAERAEMEQRAEARERDRIRKRNERAEKKQAKSKSASGGQHGHGGRPADSLDNPLDKEAPQTPEEINPPRSDPKGSSLTPTASIESEFHDQFWPAYPRKVGKREALKAFLTARKRADLETIMAGVQRYAAERQGEDPTLTKHPQGWLNGDRWLDEPTPKPPPRGQPPPSERTVSDVLGEIANGTYTHQGQSNEPDYATIETGFQRRN